MDKAIRIAPHPMTRRSWLTAALALAATGAGTAALTGCGDRSEGGEQGGEAAGVELVSSRQKRTAGDPHSRDLAAAAVQDFGADAFRTASAVAPTKNLVMSPISVHVALGMAVLGARGATAAEMLRVLHAPAAPQLAAGLNALTAQLAGPSTTVQRPDGSKATVRLSLADSVWAQRGPAWAPPFLDALAADFGAGVRAVDLVDPKQRERARQAINAWAAHETADTIRDLIPPDVLDRDTRLVLANAVHFKAPWSDPFLPVNTTDQPFTRSDGSGVRAPFMHESFGAGYARGENWQATRLPYLGGLAMTLVLPDPGRFAAVAGALTGVRLRAMLAPMTPGQVDVDLPRWRSRTSLDLKAVLKTLGMPTAFSDGADFGAMTTTADPFQIAAVLHQGYIAVDEAGTEASAATAVVERATSAAVGGHRLTFDRPFLYVIHDDRTATPLFIGQVTDPTAG